MEASVVTDPVPAGEESEITFAATTGPGPAEPTASDGSSGGDGKEASCPWSLSKREQVCNLKENWKRAFTLLEAGFVFENEFKTSPWFASIVDQLRADPCLESREFEIDQLLLGKLVWGVRMTSLDLAILMGDLKMVQKIFERSFVPDKLIRGSLLDINRALVFIKSFIYEAPMETVFSHTPLHLAIVAGGDWDIVDVLLEKGADVNAKNWRTQTPLDLTCEMEDVTMLLKLLEKDEEEGKHPLHVAVGHGNVNFLKELPVPNFNALDHKKRTPLHYLATKQFPSSQVTNIVEYLAQDKVLDMKALDVYGLSAFYVAVLHCNTQFVIALLNSFKDQIRLNEACISDRGPPIKIAVEGGDSFRNIHRALMQCDLVQGYLEKFYRDRQVYVDAANAILVGAALIASVTFASWLQPPLNYTSYFGEGSSSSIPAPSTSDLNYVDVEHNIALRAFWVFNALSFYFAIGTIISGAQSVIPRCHLFIEDAVEKLRINLLVTSILLACSVLFVIIAFAIAGIIVLTPLLKYQWCMIVPTIVGGMVCIISLVFLVISMAKNYFHTLNNSERLNQEGRKLLRDKGYIVDNCIALDSPKFSYEIAQSIARSY